MPLAFYFVKCCIKVKKLLYRDQYLVMEGIHYMLLLRVKWFMIFLFILWISYNLALNLFSYVFNFSNCFFNFVSFRIFRFSSYLIWLISITFGPNFCLGLWITRWSLNNFSLLMVFFLFWTNAQLANKFQRHKTIEFHFYFQYLFKVLNSFFQQPEISSKFCFE